MRLGPIRIFILCSDKTGGLELKVSMIYEKFKSSNIRTVLCPILAYSLL
jgi:hypothetical protein